MIPAASPRRRSPLQGMRAFLIRLGVDERGVSAVEFALSAPVMITLYFALAEFSQGYMAQKRLSHSAAATADLVAQTGAVTTDELDDIMGIGALIMKPYSATTLTTRITSVTRDANGVAKVVWSRASGVTAYAKNATVTVPTDMIANGESLVMSEATYDYNSPVKYVLPSVTKLTSVFYERPRTVEVVACGNC
ncbi:pilus assembly protein [soil metagenome]